MNTMYKTITAVPLIAAALLLVGCGESGSPGASAGGSQQHGPAPAWLLTSAPADAVPIGEAKKSAAEGDTVTVRGRIGGRLNPLSDESPVFIIIDKSVPSCDEIPGDTCPTPWDYCCEPADSIAANTATVQIVDDSGSPVATNLRAAGLNPLDEVIVVGTVAPRPSDAVLVIRASAVHRVGG